MNGRRYRGYTLLRTAAIAALLCLFLPSVFGQHIKIKSPEAVVVGEQFKVDYVIESNEEVDEAIIIKNMEGFIIIYGPTLSKSSSVQFKDGKRIATYTATSSYYLEGSKCGKHTLPKVEISIKGKKIKSDTFKIEVKLPDNAVSDADAFVKTILSKPSVNVSDTLLLTYRLYTIKQINSLINAEFPSVNEFYSTNITPSRQTFDQEVVDGKTYNVFDIRKLVLQPRKIGEITIPQGLITVEYTTPTGKKVRDMWGDVYNEAIRTEKTLMIDSVKITVHDLKAI